ncbi:hypothetical protein CF327_g526 [Tilletia walkeri]|nr:hypothetical protein CF327_g526 [Tilletia walkeri]
MPSAESAAQQGLTMPPPASTLEPPATRESSSAPGPSQPKRSHARSKTSADSMYLVAASVIVGLLLLRSGLFNALLVIVCSGLLLCNPWVRTLLELEAISAPRTGRRRSTTGDGGSSASGGDSARQSRAAFDPEMHLRERRSEDKGTRSAAGGVTDTQVVGADGKKPSLGALTVSVMPVELRRPVQKTMPFVVRDFVQFWYEPISFAHPAFLERSGATFEHLFSSIYVHTTRMNSVDFAHGLILTFTSLLIAALRQRREELGVDVTLDAPIGMQDPWLGRIHSWPTTAARIASLRASIGRFLFVHLPEPERHSALVRSLLQEILVKQVWDGIVCKMGNGEFWDQKIIESNEAPKKPVSEATATMPVGPYAAPPTQPANTATAKPSASSSAGVPAPAQNTVKTPDMKRPQAPYQPKQTQSPRRQQSGSEKPAAAFGRFTSNLFSGFVTAATRAGEVVGEAMDEAGDAMLGTAQGQQRTGSPARRASRSEDLGHATPPKSPAPYRSKASASRSPVPPPVDDLMDFSEDAHNSTNKAGFGGTATSSALEKKSPITSDVPSTTTRKPAQPYEIPEYEAEVSGNAADGREGSSSRQTHSFPMDESVMRSDLPRELSEVPLPKSLRSSLPATSGAEATSDTGPKRASVAGPPLPTRRGPDASGDQHGSPRSDASTRNSPLKNSTDFNSATSTPSVPVSTQLKDRPQSSTSASRSTPHSREIPAAPPLASLLDARTMASSELFDAFEVYLSQRTASDPADPDQPTHGEMLFRLWTQLRTLRSIGEIEMQASGFGAGPFDAGLGIGTGLGAGGMKLWAEDVKGALMGRHGSASRLDDRQLESARDESIGMLERVDTHGLNALDPLEEAVEARLQKLYASFWVDRVNRHPDAVRHFKIEPKTASKLGGLPAIGTSLPVKTEPLPTSPLPSFDRVSAVKAEDVPTPRKKASSHSPNSTTSPTQPSHRRAETRADISPKIASPLSPTGSGMSPTMASSPSRASAPQPPPTARLRQDQLDTMISAIFQVAHEALGLSTGGWTVRRGMLRVLEQICRTAYASILLGSFNSSVSALSTKGAGEYIDATRESWWPNGEWAATPELSKEEQKEEAIKKRERSVRAREIVRSYAPAQAGYVLGPGGRQACVDALDAVYETLTHPITALDISLTLTLEVLDSLTVVS